MEKDSKKTNISIREKIPCPDGLFLSPSKIPRVGHGVWTRIPVPAGTLYAGPFDEQHQLASKECKNTTNWMRFIKRARCDEEQNLTAIQRYGHIYYQTVKNVPANDELLVWYDESLSAILGIDPTRDITKDDCGLYTCLKCLHPFMYRNSLLWHKLQNSECKNYEPKVGVCSCDGCGAEFQEQRLLKIHIMEHYTEMQLRLLMKNTGLDLDGSVNSTIPSTAYNTAGTTPFSSGPDRTDTSSSSYSTSLNTSSSFNVCCHDNTSSFNGSKHTSEDGYRTSPENLTDEMEQHDGMSVNRDLELLSCNLITAQTKCCTNKVLHAHSYTESETSLNGNAPLRHELASNSRGSHVILPETYNEKGCNITRPTTGINQPIVPLPCSDMIYQDQPTVQKYCPCQICGKRFASAWTLREHSRVHTGERPYECTVCGKKFAHHSNMVRHYRIHTGERPYHCPYCDRKFAVHSNLTAHYPTHLGIKQFSCGTCHKSFVHASSLHKHLKSYNHTGVVKNICLNLRKVTRELTEAQKQHATRNQMSELLKTPSILNKL
ncbi:zinc finger protein Xfin-like [Bolinopsis microptera]|uniref:zinc finger protein Xfin-like n=1 Tax=Bolinopsis microptera TaxID=2820187 RepID=UPI00307A202B